MGKIYTSPPGVVLYENLFELKDYEGDGRFRYSVVIGWPKAEAKILLADMVKHAEAAAASKWPDAIPKPFLWPFRDGDNTDREEKHGLTYVRFASKNEPKVVGPVAGADGTLPKLGKGAVYSGCEGRVSYDAYPWDKKSKGVSFGLVNFQFLRDGEPIGGGGSSSNPDDDFDSVEPDDLPDESDAPGNDDMPGFL